MKLQVSTELSELPVTVIIQILQKLPLQQRLSQAAFVCTTWASAAAAATVHVHHKVKPESVPACEAWLEQHAGQLISLQLSSTQTLQPEDKLQVPWDHFKVLQRLHLQRFRLQLPGEGGSTAEDGRFAAHVSLPSLQHLELWSITLSSPDGLLQLTAAPQLTSLQMQHISIAQPSYCTASGGFGSEAAAQQVAEALLRMLRQLPRLAVLELPGFPVTDEIAQQLGAMNGLKQVSLGTVQNVPTFDLQLLPTSITQLQLQGRYTYINYSPSHSPSLSPALQRFTGLLALKLEGCAVPCAVLAAIPQLQQLQMEHCALLPRTVPHHQFNAAGTAALLAAVPELTSLQHLQLKLPTLDTMRVLAQRFSALTASSFLTELRFNPDDYIPLPRGAARHMFSAGRQWPLLQRLIISPELSGDPLSSDEWCIDSADLRCICKGCPGLQWLDLTSTVRLGADLSVLLQLPECCTSLIVGGAGFTDAAAPVLAQLTQLGYLSWCYSRELTDVGLEHLTALTGLTSLCVHSCNLGASVSEGDDVGLVKLTTDQAASVSEQLVALCDNSPACARVRRQQAEIQQLQQENSSLHRQLTEKDDQIRQLQQQLVAAQSSQQQ